VSALRLLAATLVLGLAACAGDGDGTPGADDDAPATCDRGAVVGHIEEEPNTRWDTDVVAVSAGAVHVSGTLDCGNDGDRYIADLDWFAVTLLCGGAATAELTWGGDRSDLDLEVYRGEGRDWNDWDRLVGEYSTEREGPEAYPVDLEAEEPLHLFVGCWSGERTSYELWVRWGDGSDR